jgi:hypothetical protein
MIDIKQIIQEASVDAMHRNVKFIKNLLIDSMNMERIGSIVIFTASNPNSVQPIDTKTNDELIWHSAYCGQSLLESCYRTA